MESKTSFYSICNYVNSRVRSKCFVGRCERDDLGHVVGRCEGDLQCSQRVQTADFGHAYNQTADRYALFNQSGVCYGEEGKEGFCSCRQDFGCGSGAALGSKTGKQNLSTRFWEQPARGGNPSLGGGCQVYSGTRRWANNVTVLPPYAGGAQNGTMCGDYQVGGMRCGSDQDCGNGKTGVCDRLPMVNPHRCTFDRDCWFETPSGQTCDTTAG